ncbi:MAG: hypothetical protein ACTSX4_08645 [Candidatus Helarchaeota archaeon]
MSDEKEKIVQDEEKDDDSGSLLLDADENTSEEKTESGSELLITDDMKSEELLSSNDGDDGAQLLIPDDGSSDLLLEAEDETEEIKSELLAEIEETKSEVASKAIFEEQEELSFDEIAISESEKQLQNEVKRIEEDLNDEKIEEIIKEKSKKKTSYKALISFDINFNERGRIYGSYSELRDLLLKNNYYAVEYNDMLMQSRLSKTDVLVLPCPDASKLNPYEINQIKRFVNNGGGLLLLSHAGGDHGRGTNLNELAKEFGIHFENNQVLDDIHNYGLNTFPVISNFIDHPITKELKELCLRAGCSINTFDPAVSVAFADVIADPTNADTVAVSEMGLGRVIAIGAYEMFRNEVVQWASHEKFIINIFDWLTEKKDLAAAIQLIDAFASTISKKMKQGTQRIFKTSKSGKPRKTFQLPVLAPISSKGGLGGEDLQIIIDGFNDVLTVTNELKDGFTKLSEEFQKLKLEIKDDISELKGFNTGLLRDLEKINMEMADKADSDNAISQLLMDLGKKIDKILRIQKKSKKKS